MLLSLVIAFFTVSFWAEKEAMGQLCPPSGCDPYGWNTSIRQQTIGTAIEHQINSSEGQMFLYNTRDFVSNSQQLGYMSSEIYNYWSEFSFAPIMLNEYEKLYSSGLVQQTSEIMYPSGNMESEVFLTDGMYSAVKKILDFHKNSSSNDDFIQFLEETELVVEDMKGKSIYQIRSIYFPCGQPNWC